MIFLFKVTPLHCSVSLEIKESSRVHYTCSFFFCRNRITTGEALNTPPVAFSIRCPALPAAACEPPAGLRHPAQPYDSASPPRRVVGRVYNNGLWRLADRAPDLEGAPDPRLRLVDSDLHTRPPSCTHRNLIPASIVSDLASWHGQTKSLRSKLKDEHHCQATLLSTRSSRSSDLAKRATQNVDRYGSTKGQ